MASTSNGGWFGGAGLPRAVLFLLWLLCLIATGRSTAAEDLTGDRLYDPGRLCEIAIVVPEADWRTLRLQTRDFRTAFTDPQEKPFTYFKADITIDGVPIGSVGIRKKGFLGSLDDRFPSLKIDFSQFASQDPIPGLETLTLNNNKQDTSLVSQLLTYRLFNAAGIHAPRVGFARVTVNGEYLGVYTNIESIGKPFLNRHFGESSGKLYEGTLADFYPSALANLELKINRREPDSGTTMRLAQLLASKEPLVLEEVEKLVDVTPFLRYWALEGLLAFWDGYCNNQNNFWVYEQGNGKLFFMPWGADMAFAGGKGFLGFGGVVVYGESMLANRLYHTEGMPERYRETMQELLETVWREPELLLAIDNVTALVGDHLHQRQSNAKREMQSVRKFISTRRDVVTRLLKKWPAEIPGEPRKPVYNVPIGAVTGTFTTRWADTPPDNPLENGAAELRMTIRGKEVAFEKLGVSAQPALPSPFGNPAGPPPGPPGAVAPNQKDASAPAPAANQREPTPVPASIEFIGVRASDSKRLTLTLIVDRTLFAAAAGKSVPVRGTLLIGEEKASIFNPLPGKTVSGKVQFSQVGLATGEAVAGKLDVTISESHGGMLRRREPRGGKNAAPGESPARGSN